MHATVLPLELAAENISPYAQRRGLIQVGPASVEELGGGVSSRVYLVAGAGQRLVLKQPLPRFRVRDEWLVDTHRVEVEADFLRLVGARLPRNAVPEFVAFDTQDKILVVRAAPATFQPWKSRLLVGEVDEKIGAQAGALLGKIHRIGVDAPELRASFDQPELFHQQRIDPYVRALVARHPTLAGALGEAINHLEHDRSTLIHGDFSPKNLLTDGRSLMLVDHEVATWNDPLFDVCFFLNHLLLKAVHLPSSADEYHACAGAFLQAYLVQAPPVARKRPSEPSHLLPVLMLARVDGKSPVEYLSEESRRIVRQRAVRWLEAKPRSTSEYVAQAFLN
jgi:5-methylthioribose kinase